MTLSEAVQATHTGFVTKTGCIGCKQPVSEASGEGDWEPWTDVHEAQSNRIMTLMVQQLGAFDCPGCSA